MSSSTLSSPTAKNFKPSGRRVSFNVANAGNLPAPSPVAAAKGRRLHHYHSSSNPFMQPSLDRRSKVEDATDIDDDSDSTDLRLRAGANAKAKAQSKNTNGGPLLPTTTATAAALGVSGSASNPCVKGATGLHAVHTNINPALGVNPIFTHANNPFPGYSQMPYGIPGQPGFVAATAAGHFPYPVATHLAAGTDPSSNGVTFVPAVPDATNGPMLHTYIPRNDIPVASPGGIVYVQAPHPGFATAQGMPLSGVPIAAGGIATTTAPMMPYLAQQQPGMAQPTYIRQVPMASGGYRGGGLGGGPPTFMMMPGGAPMPGNYGEAMGIHPEAAVGVGQTPGEVLQEQLEFAYANDLNEPQDFKPADDDKSRFYWVRELDGNWTQRNRATVDRIGCRCLGQTPPVYCAIASKLSEKRNFRKALNG